MLITNKKDIKRYYKALLERNSQFTGIFYVGVKTTGIFCISTCRARKPRPENVVFYTEIRELLQNGYKPCKICKPTENAHHPPEDVVRALNLINGCPTLRLRDYQLRQKKLSPEKIRRWFKKNHNITFHTYERMLRINDAFQELRRGRSVANTAFDSGYESLSGLGYSFKSLTGVSPKDSNKKSIISIVRITTPLGPMFACATHRGICLLEFTDRRMLETELRDLQKFLDASILVGQNDHIKQLKTELIEYFGGTRKQFTVKLDTPGTRFQQAVWEELKQIPYGETRYYSEQAAHLNRYGAIRAVAAANGSNRVAIVIPCHRVIGKDGKLTGYGGGLERKKWLLKHERKNTLPCSQDNYTFFP